MNSRTLTSIRCILVLLLWCCNLASSSLLTDGGQCPSSYCVPLRQCSPLLRSLRSNNPQKRRAVTKAICGFKGRHAKVCCMEPHIGVAASTTTQRTTAKPRRLRGPSRLSSHGQEYPLPPGGPALFSKLNDVSTLLPESCGLPRLSSRIYGGVRAELASQPWIAAISYTDPSTNAAPALLCSGALLNNRYVVTAAHCLDERETDYKKISTIRLGEWRVSSDSDCSGGVCAKPVVEVGVEEAVIHPQYNKRFRFSDDIALLRLNTTVSFDMFVQPLCLPPSVFGPTEVAIGSPVTVAGWGRTQQLKASDVLRTVTLKIANPYTCLKVFPTYFDINGGQICIGGNQGEDTCKGDSGSPVFKMGRYGSHYLLAITSYGSSICGRKNYPAVYTSVPHYTTWIRQRLRA